MSQLPQLILWPSWQILSLAFLLLDAAQSAVKSTFIASAISKCGGNVEKGTLLYSAYGSNGQVRFPWLVQKHCYLWTPRISPFYYLMSWRSHTEKIKQDNRKISWERGHEHSAIKRVLKLMYALSTSEYCTVQYNLSFWFLKLQ